jgi:hypothetical protein
VTTVPRDMRGSSEVLEEFKSHAFKVHPALHTHDAAQHALSCNRASQPPRRAIPPSSTSAPRWRCSCRSKGLVLTAHICSPRNCCSPGKGLQKQGKAGARACWFSDAEGCLAVSEGEAPVDGTAERELTVATHPACTSYCGRTTTTPVGPLLECIAASNLRQTHRSRPCAASP